MSNKKILQGHNKALESLVTIAGIPIEGVADLLSKIGVTKWESGSFTLAADASSVKIEHSLGVIPLFVLVQGVNVSGGYVVRFLSTFTDQRYGEAMAAYFASGSQGAGTNETKVSSENVLYIRSPKNQTWNFKAGVKYSYILMA